MTKGCTLGYLKELEQLDATLDEKYRFYIDNLNRAMEKYYGLLQRAFSPNYAEAIDGSIALAQYAGVPYGEILKSKSEVDHYFLD